MTRRRITPDIFDIESDWLDRALMDFAPDQEPEPDDDPIDDQPLAELIAECDELIAEIDRKLGR
jgi:hypothetical protein